MPLRDGSHGGSTGCQAVKRRPAVACFVTPHGFGHAARAAAILAALRERVPGLDVHLFTTVPRWFFRDSIGADFSLHRVDADVGLVQRDPLSEDLPATVARLRALYPPNPALLAPLGRALRRNGCRLVLCDISPLGIAAARAAGLPSVLVENVSGAWIARGCTRREPRLAPFASLIGELARDADLHLQTEPICRPDPGALPVGPVSRRPRATRAATRAALGVPARRPLVLVTMGGIRHGGFAVAPLSLLSGVEFVLAGGGPARRRVGNALILPHRSGFYHPDLVAAADAVVGKIGYSTLAESCRAGVPFGFVPRAGFRESAVLGRWLLGQGRGLRIGPAAFASGEWVRRVPELLGLGRKRERFTDGAREAAALILDRFPI
jgi:hypothetical protein